MKLLLIFAAILAFSLAEEEKKKEIIEDSEAEASATIELLKEGADLSAAASSYNTYVPPSQRPSQWNQPNYVPHEPSKPIQPVNTGVPANVQSDYYGHHHQTSYPHWSTPNYHPPTTPTPVSVIKNEQYFGDNGYYKYEYQMTDGTHVGEEGYYVGKQEDENLVKKGWYSYRGADGKTYTVTYWADRSGYHAFGDHLPTPPPVPAAIQAALDQEKEAEKYKPQHDYPTQTPAPVYYPTLPPSPPKVTYNPQPPSYAPPSYTTLAPPTYQPPYYPQQPYSPPQQTYYPPQQPYYPPQQNY